MYDDGDDKMADKTWLPPPSKQNGSSLKEIKEKYLRPLIPVMDLFNISIRGLHAIMLALRPFDAPSLSTVDREVKAVREEALQWVKNQPFPRRGVLHFDGVKVTLGSKNGKR